MSRMQTTDHHGVKIYNLSSGKTVPQWLSEKQKRSLAKDADYQRRVELLQDFDFPTASQRIRLSPDGQYVVVTGSYPPQVKVYQVSELSLKFERHLDCDVADMLVLSNGYEKLVFLQEDRTIAFHAAYGAHCSVRVPRFGRSLAYHQATCDLLVGCSGGDIYRLDLEGGRFRAPITLPNGSDAGVGVNKLALAGVHQLLAAGTDDGFVHFWDTRVGGRGRACLASLPLVDGVGAAAAARATEPLEVTSLAFDTDGLSFAVGSSSAQCLVYDLRSPRPLIVKEHNYGLPVIDVRFHHGLHNAVISTDRKIIKAWDRNIGDERQGGDSAGGKAIANIETSADVNDVVIAHDSRGDSGLVLAAGEQARVMAYYVPVLGPAPRWCSFLDSLTEELEEETGTAVYEDYQFVTKDEVSELGIDNLVGTPLLRGYMHGFFMDANLYRRMRDVSQPFAYQEWRKKKLQDRVEEKRRSRIALREKVPKVNRALAEKLLKRAEDAGARPDAADGEEGERAAGALSDELVSNPLGDARFSAMFKSQDFEVDPTSQEFQLRHPSAGAQAQSGRKSKRRNENEDSADDLDDEGPSGANGAFHDSLFDSDGGASSSDEESRLQGDGIEQQTERSSARGRAPSTSGAKQANGRGKAALHGAPRQQRPQKAKFVEVRGGDVSELVGAASAGASEQQRERKRLREVPLLERVSGGGGGGGVASAHGEPSRMERGRIIPGATAREFSFVPRGSAGRSGRGRGRDGGGGRGGGGGRRGGGGGRRGGGRGRRGRG